MDTRILRDMIILQKKGYIGMGWVLGIWLVLLLLVAVPVIVYDRTFRTEQFVTTVNPIYDFNQPNATRTRQAENSTAENILNDPSSYYGRVVSIGGTVDKTVGDYAVTLDRPGFVGDQLLVLTTTHVRAVGGGGDNELYKDKTISVNGIVRPFNLKAIEQELGIDLHDEEYKDWEGKPVIVSQSLQTSQ